MGFLDGLIGGGTSGATKEGMGFTRSGVSEMLNQLRQAQSAYQSDVASGRYDPTQSLSLAKDQLSHAFDIHSGNLAAQQGGFGYKAGDSNLAQGQRNLSAGSDLAGQQMMMEIRRQFGLDQDRGRGIVSNAADHYANSAQGAGGQFMNYGAQQEARGGLGGALGGISGIMSMFGPKGGGGSITPNPTQYPHPIGPGMPGMPGLTAPDANNPFWR